MQTARSKLTKLDLNEPRDDGAAVAAAEPYTDYLHLTTDICMIITNKTRRINTHTQTHRFNVSKQVKRSFIEPIIIKPLMLCKYQHTANRNVFSCLQKVSLLTAGSLK